MYYYIKDVNNIIKYLASSSMGRVWWLTEKDKCLSATTTIQKTMSVAALLFATAG